MARLLAEHVANQFATREVVERPSSARRSWSKSRWTQARRRSRSIWAGRSRIKLDGYVLMVLASQAVTAISNTRVDREEWHARAGLEAFVKILPVGIVLLDTRTAELAWFNREAGRIVNHHYPLESP